jgi:parallel beta-helix repeat protein
MGTLGDGIEIGATLKATATVGNIVRNNRCHDNVVDGISVAQSKNTLVSGNVIYNNGASGIGIESSSEGTQIVDNKVYNNSCTFAAGAGIAVIDASTKGTIITSNSVFKNAQNGVFLSKNSTQTYVCSNQVYDNGQKSAGTFDGIAVLATNNTLTGNTCFDDQAAKTQRFGINVGSGFLNNSLTGNVFSVT